jgi:large subunit ribosomal protein L25
VNVPIVLTGTAEGVRAEGGTLDQTMRELEIRVDAANIPAPIEVDVSGLHIGHSIHVSDLAIPEGVEVLDEQDATVCVVSAPRAIEEPVAVEAVAAEVVAEEPEVIGKGKEEVAEETEEE